MSQDPTARAEGTRIYNHGDMANQPHFGTIIQNSTDAWGEHVTIRTDAEDSKFDPEDRVESHDYTVPASMVGDIFKGNGLTRIVTEEAYQAWRAAEIQKLTRIQEGA